jgi:chaperone required for assembly of F1-ATPase
MKRFWKEARAVGPGAGWTIHLDGRPLNTPAKRPFLVPAEGLVQAIAAEWNGAEDQFDPRAMPLTGLANAAIDRIAPDPEGFAGGLARYGESDLLCYRAETPPQLIDRQAKRWDPLLAWARLRYDVDFAVTAGIAPIEQPEATLAQLRHAVATLDPFRLAGLSSLVTIGGSLVAALAIVERAVTADEAWTALTLDDRWQLEQWGADEEAEAALAARYRDFVAAANFLTLLD